MPKLQYKTIANYLHTSDEKLLNEAKTALNTSDLAEAEANCATLTSAMDQFLEPARVTRSEYTKIGLWGGGVTSACVVAGLTAALGAPSVYTAIRTVADGTLTGGFAGLMFGNKEINKSMSSQAYKNVSALLTAANQILRGLQARAKLEVLGEEKALEAQSLRRRY